MNRDYWDDEIRNLKERIEALEAALQKLSNMIYEWEVNDLDWFEIENFIDEVLKGEKNDND